MPHAPCPMPYALCPMPMSPRIFPLKGYSLSIELIFSRIGHPPIREMLKAFKMRKYQLSQIIH